MHIQLKCNLNCRKYSTSEVRRIWRLSLCVCVWSLPWTTTHHLPGQWKIAQLHPLSVQPHIASKTSSVPCDARNYFQWRKSQSTLQVSFLLPVELSGAQHPPLSHYLQVQATLLPRQIKCPHHQSLWPRSLTMVQVSAHREWIQWDARYYEADIISTSYHSNFFNCL